MTRRQKRIIHQIESEIEGLQVAHDHITCEHGTACKEAVSLGMKLCVWKDLLEKTYLAFEHIGQL